MSVLVSACISYHLVVNVVLASNSTSSDENDATMKAMLTVGILVACVIIALVVAKIVDSCYEHHIAISDDASDISEDTRKLLRLRLVVNSLWTRKTREEDVMPREKQRKIIRLWSARAKESRRIAELRRAESNKTKQGDKKNIIKVEEASGNAKLQTDVAAAAAQFLTVPETTGNVSPVKDLGAKSSEKQMSSQRSKSLTPHRQDTNKLSSENLKLSPSPKPRSRANTLHTTDTQTIKGSPHPETKKVLKGVTTGKSKAEASAVVHVTTSANPSILVGKESLLQDSDGEVLSIELHGEELETLQSAVELGQDTVRSEANPDLVALSCRSDVSTFSGPILQGLNPADTASLEQQPAEFESEEPDSTQSDSHVVVLHSPAVSARTQNCVVSLVSHDTDDERDLVSSQPHSWRSSDFTIVDITGIQKACKDIETYPDDSHHEQEQCPDDNDARSNSPTDAKIFTIDLPTEQQFPTADSGNAKQAPPFCRQKGKSQSFDARDMMRLSKMSPRLAQSVRLYTGVKKVSKMRKGLRFQKAASGSSIHASTVTPISGDLEKTVKVEKDTDATSKTPAQGERF